MADFDAKRLQDEGGNNLNFVPTNFMDAQGNSKSIEVEFGKKQNTLSLEADSEDISDNTTIVKNLDGAKLKTALAVKFWNYIKGKANSVYAALGHSHSISDVTGLSNAITDKQDLQKTVNLEQSLSDVSYDSIIVSEAYLNILHRLSNNGNNVFVTYKVGELSENGHYEISLAYIDVPYSLNDSKKASIHVLLDLTDATRTYPIADQTNFLMVMVRDSAGNSLFHEGGNAQTVKCILGRKYIFHITGNTFTSRPLNRRYYLKSLVEGFVNTNAWNLIGSSTVDYELCNWGDGISSFMPGSSNKTRSQYGYLFTLIYTLSIIVENNSSADINVAFNLGRTNTDLTQTRPVLVGCGQYVIVPANSRKYIDLSATDVLSRYEFDNTYGNLKLFMTIDGRSWTSTDRVYVGKGHARMIVDFTDPIQH